jgi:2-iminobutanoate/2-iminopropanoate deaminase
VSEKEVVRTELAPAPFEGAPYSQAIRAGGFVFVSGLVALQPGSDELVGETIEEQTEQVFANLRAVLAAAGSSLDQLVKTTVFLADLDDFGGMNEIYVGMSATHRPHGRPSRCRGCPRERRSRSRRSRSLARARPGRQPCRSGRGLRPGRSLPCGC